MSEAVFNMVVTHSFVYLFLIFTLFLSYRLKYWSYNEDVATFGVLLGWFLVFFTPFLTFVSTSIFVTNFYFHTASKIYDNFMEKRLLNKNPELVSLRFLEKLVLLYKSRDHLNPKDVRHDNSEDNHLFKELFNEERKQLLHFVQKNHHLPYVSHQLTLFSSSFSNMLDTIKGSSHLSTQTRASFLRAYGDTIHTFLDSVKQLKTKEETYVKISEDELVSIDRVMEEIKSENEIFRKRSSEIYSLIQGQTKKA